MAATSHKNCDTLHRTYYKCGVARSHKAARKQVNTGHHEPKVSRAVYPATTRLYADKSGTTGEGAR